MPRRPIGDRPMTDAERQARHRAAQTAGRPAIHIRPPTDRRSRIQRWRDAVTELTKVQAQCVAWLEALPPNLHEGATAEALLAICDLDLSELLAVEPPRGFGRDWPPPVQQPTRDTPSVTADADQ